MFIEELYTIGDSLNDESFNALVSLYRQSIVNSENVEITEEHINGLYAEYTFNINNATILDNGVKINEDTSISVNLINPLFHNSTYKLKLNILHFTGMNIFDDISPSNYKIVDTLEIELQENQEVTIPVSELTGYIIGFTGTIYIKHDRTQILGSWVNNLTITSDKNIVTDSEVANITATALDLQDLPVHDKEITIYHNNELLDILQTDEHGEVITEYTGTGAGIQTIYADAGHLQSNTITIIDALFHDKGTDTEYANWTTYSNMKAERNTDNTELVPVNTSAFASVYKTLPTDINYIIEFDLLYNGYGTTPNILSFRNNSTTILAYNSIHLGITDGVWSHIKLEVTENSVTATVDGETKTPRTYSNSINRFYVAKNANTNWEISYKNFMIYPSEE